MARKRKYSQEEVAAMQYKRAGRKNASMNKPNKMHATVNGEALCGTYPPYVSNPFTPAHFPKGSFGSGLVCQKCGAKAKKMGVSPRHAKGQVLIEEQALGGSFNASPTGLEEFASIHYPDELFDVVYGALDVNKGDVEKTLLGLEGDVDLRLKLDLNTRMMKSALHDAVILRQLRENKVTTSFWGSNMFSQPSDSIVREPVMQDGRVIGYNLFKNDGGMFGAKTKVGYEGAEPSMAPATEAAPMFAASEPVVMPMFGAESAPAEPETTEASEYLKRHGVSARKKETCEPARDMWGWKVVDDEKDYVEYKNSDGKHIIAIAEGGEGGDWSVYIEDKEGNLVGNVHGSDNKESALCQVEDLMRTKASPRVRKPTEPDEEDYVICPSGSLGAKTSVGQGGKHLGEFRSEGDEERKFV